MAQNEDHWNASAKFPVHRLDIFDLDSLEDFLWRQCGEFNATKKVSAQSSEMPTHEPAHFTRCLFAGKRYGNVAFGQVSILSGNEAGTKTEELSEYKEKPHWQCGGNGQPSAIEKINNEIEHCRADGIAARRGRVDLPAACFNQYNVRGVGITFPFF
jgi:hypothetical protein